MLSHRRSRRAAAITLTAVISIGVAVAGYPAVAEENGTTECRDVGVPVKVGGSEGSIAGTLCAPPEATSVQVLVHGLTYNRHYFDSPYRPQTYSYAQAANKAGYATLSIDRLGVGESMKPLSLFNTFDADVRTVHEVVQALRDGSLGTAYDKVMTVGHSLSSGVVSAEAGKFDDVDAMITTGYAHAYNAAYTFPSVVGREHLAAGDEEFADQGLDPLYLTSIPGTRYTFYNTDNVDDRMIDTDEKSMRDTESLVKIATYPSPADIKDQNRDTDIPVLATMGTKDPFFCGVGTTSCQTGEQIAEFERQWYDEDATVEGYAVPDAGHNLQLENSSGDAAERMLRFANEHVGAGDGVTDSEPGVRPDPEQRPQTEAPLPYRLANKGLSEATLPVIDKYSETVDPLPGMEGTNPVPLTGDVLAEVAKLTGKAQEPLP